MSSTNQSGGGCGCLLLIIIALVLLAATKPAQPDHQAIIAKKTPVLRALAGMQEFLGVGEFKYHDYILFSTMTWADKSGHELPVSTGYLGKVHYYDDK